ncbi:hypothetical protein J2D73_19715 [Acetobacter sacchari]|uniref:Uncharacterized protein n=1 Tax=Acetobacter sacchari TaxID=2661687 RepID=A0ABS3M1J2_9PROT|nr:hypothetical protein [Acetobacter sacchari]MBO1362013.1 hypothetical protein [Acetobacter sacchari]
MAALICSVLASGHTLAQTPHQPPQITNWKSLSDVRFDDHISINGDQVTFPHLGAFKLEYYGSFPGQENQISPDVYVIRPVSGAAHKQDPFCASKDKPAQGYVTLLADKDVLDRPVLIYTALEPAFVPGRQDSGKTTPLQSCEQVTFASPQAAAQ